MEKSLGELLVEEKILSPDQVEKVYAKQRADGGRFTSRLLELGLLSERQLSEFLAKQYGAPFVQLDECEVDPEVLKLIPQKIVQTHLLFPLSRAGSTMVVAVSDPTDLAGVDEIKFLANCNVEIVVALEAEIRKAIAEHYNSPGEMAGEMGDDFPNLDAQVVEQDYDIVHEEEEVDVTDLAKATEEAPIVKLVNYILADAIRKRASDIHLEAYEKKLRVRYRIDGLLQEGIHPPLKIKNALVSRIKVMSMMDIAERRLPQDGRFKLRVGPKKEIDFRVSVLPCIHGEKVVMRLLDKASLQLDMKKLGFEEVDLAKFKEAIDSPYGMILVTGPTGSGKTTTLYSALSELNQIDVNISTAEDPVEYNLEGINQVQVHEEIGLTFAASLRSFLRQDPDIIMVGEIRDLETAEVAVKAALTGHLLLSTLHTNDASSTITRLVNMGVEPFLVTASLRCVVAQRLVRQICKHCRARAEVSESLLHLLQMDPTKAKKSTFYQGKGCGECGQTGYRGRIGLYEVLLVTDPIKKLIIGGGTADEINQQAISEGMKTLRVAGLEKLEEGRTTVEEVLRVTAS
ncbi:MAG: type IV-A pilus assembly ATPase PilB [Deltaproteobacteria bacterium]|nr:type IV-A pilus assembly ATPase PilB [Deltaproteobacteria bacterium]